MVLRLGTALGVPLRQVNAMLRASGHAPAYEESTEALPAPVLEALSLLKDHHEPYPLVVVDRTYAVRDLNRGALAVLGAVLGPVPADEGTGAAPTAGMNLALLTFDPTGAQPHLVNFDEVGRELLWRVQREVLADPDDDELRDLLDALLDMPTVRPDWRQVDLSAPESPALVLHLRGGGLELRFLTVITRFEAPHDAAVEELRIETWLPHDAATAAACRRLSAGIPAPAG